MDGTYIREPDGAALLRYSARFWNDPTYALRDRPEAFAILHPTHPAWDAFCQSEAQYLVPGEWMISDGPLTEIGGAL